MGACDWSKRSTHTWKSKHELLTYQKSNEFRFSDWLNKGPSHVYTQVDSNSITQCVWNELVFYMQVQFLFGYFYRQETWT